MRIKQRTPKQNVKAFKRNMLPIQVANLEELTDAAVEEYGGSPITTRRLLRREYYRQNISKRIDEESNLVIFFARKEVRKSKARFPKRRPRPRSISNLGSETAFGGAEA